jgi:hypothetical protein
MSVRATDRDLRGDEGMALAIALLVVMCVGIAVSASLSFAGTGLQNVPHLRVLRNQTLYGEGAVDGAINQIRRSSLLGTPLVSCPTFTPPVVGSSDPGADGSSQFRVTCQPIATTNGLGTNAPDFAIQTLNTGAESLSTTKNDTLLVDGDIYSAGAIDVGQGAQAQIASEGSVYAAGACSAGITVTDPRGPQCSQGVKTGAPWSDPQYAPAVSGASGLSTVLSQGVDPLPTCSGSTATFAPGYYGELPDTLASIAGCANPSLERFTPGFYYFDFTNARAGTQWNPGAVIAGTLAASGTTCDSTTDKDGNPVSPGVQFIFGGASTLNIGNNFAICGPSPVQLAGSPQSIAIYGLNGNNNQGTSVPAADTDHQEPAASAPTAVGFQPASSAQSIDGTSASATLGASATASLAYAGFGQVPDGVAIKSVKLKLVRTVSAGSLSTETLSYQYKDGSSTNISVKSCASPCTQDITSSLPSNHLDWKEVDGLTASYTATTGRRGSATDTVDGLTVLVTYVKPTFEPLQATSADFFGGTASSLFTYGTIYAPSGDMTVSDHNKSLVGISRGVVVSTLEVDASASFKQTNAPFQVPRGTASRLVQFTEQDRPDGSSAWQTHVVACVLYSDSGTSGTAGAALPGSTVTVKRWNVLRSPTDEAATCGS